MLRFWIGTVHAYFILTKNGLFLRTVRLALSLYKVTVFSFLYGTVNAFLIKTGNGQFFWYGTVRTKKMMTKNYQNLLTYNTPL